jgi:hypothetical protein
LRRIYHEIRLNRLKSRSKWEVPELGVKG